MITNVPCFYESVYLSAPLFFNWFQFWLTFMKLQKIRWI